MSYTNELIDRYKKAIKVDSDYAVAKALGLRPNRISNYRTGTSHADDKTAVMLATVLHLDPMETIARINMDRATDKEDKAFWRKLAGTAAMLLIVLFPALPSYAATLPEPENKVFSAEVDQPELCIMRSAKAWCMGLARWLARTVIGGRHAHLLAL